MGSLEKMIEKRCQNLTLKIHLTHSIFILIVIVIYAVTFYRIHVSNGTVALNF